MADVAVASPTEVFGSVSQRDRAESARKAAVLICCPLCGSFESEVVSSKDDLEEQYRDLLRFYHVRRRGARTPSECDHDDLADRLLFTQDYFTNIDRCLGCSLLFRSPRPQTPVIEENYTSDRYSELHLVREFQRQEEWAKQRIITLARWLWRSGVVRPRVIEVGSFVGGFLAVAKECGWSVLGIDPGEQVCDFCRARDLPVFQGTLPDLGAAPESVDAVVILNTFAQLPDPHPTLAAARRALRPEGLLVVRVPNGECFRWMSVKASTNRFVAHPLLRRILAWNHLLAFPYLYGYSTKALDHLMSRYQLTRLQSYPDSLMPLAGSETHWWAACEEWIIKWMCRTGGRLEQLINPEGDTIAPWIDHYYRPCEANHLSRTGSRAPTIHETRSCAIQ